MINFMFYKFHTVKKSLMKSISEVPTEGHVHVMRRGEVRGPRAPLPKPPQAGQQRGWATVTLRTVSSNWEATTVPQNYRLRRLELLSNVTSQPSRVPLRRNPGWTDRASTHPKGGPAVFPL